MSQSIMEYDPEVCINVNRPQIAFIPILGVPMAIAAASDKS